MNTVIRPDASLNWSGSRLSGRLPFVPPVSDYRSNLAGNRCRPTM
jgi:hypothetical protein